MRWRWWRWCWRWWRRWWWWWWSRLLFSSQEMVKMEASPVWWISCCSLSKQRISISFQQCSDPQLLFSGFRLQTTCFSIKDATVRSPAQGPKWENFYFFVWEESQWCMHNIAYPLTKCFKEPQSTQTCFWISNSQQRWCACTNTRAQTMKHWCIIANKSI